MGKNEWIKEYFQALQMKPNVKTLSDVQLMVEKHLSSFAFSSVKVLLKEHISLDLKDIFNSLVIQRRGGYCFEHNKLIYEVLKELGFDVQFFLARVVNNREEEVPQTHRFTVLNFENKKYLIDVGIGFRSPNILIDFNQAWTKGALGINYRIKAEKNKYYLERLVDHALFKMTEFDLNPCYEVDFELGHFYSHQHPEAVFVNHLVVSLSLKDEIRSLRNSDYFKIYKDKQEVMKIRTKKELSDILTQEMKLNLKAEEINRLFDFIS